MAGTLMWGKYVVCKITGPQAADIIPDGAVFQRDGEIIEVGAYEELRDRHPAAESIGSRQAVVIPGLVNDHFHVGVTPFQLGAPDLPLELWALAKIGLKVVDPYLDHLYGAIQMIESGTTTVQVLHYAQRGQPAVNVETAAKALKAYEDAGMRVSYAMNLVNQNSLAVGPEGGEQEFASLLPPDVAGRFRALMARQYLPAREYISNVEALWSLYGDGRHERVRITLGPSTVDRCSDELLLAARELASQLKTGIHIHLQETLYQKAYGLRTRGRTPLQHLHTLGFLGPDVTCGHSVWLTDEDIELIASTGTRVCHNASSNLRLQSGIAPINRLLQRGVRIALGTDEAGLNDDKDMFQEMRLALNLHREPGIDNVSPTAHQVFEMATVNGAQAASVGDRVGTLEPGKRADIAIVSLRSIAEPYLDPAVSIVDALVHRGRGSDVESVMINGEVVMRDGRLARIDKESVLAELARSLSRPLSPEEIERRGLGKQLEPYLRQFLTRSTKSLSQPHYQYNARL